MLNTKQIRAVTTRAARVLHDVRAMDRIRDGYTRVDPFQIAHSADVIVMLRPLQKLLGAFVRQDQPGILVNSERPAGLIQMTCAHELGHYFLDHESSTDHNLDYAQNAHRKELEADWFAYSLVAPRWAIANIMKKKRWGAIDLNHPFILYQLSLRLGISYQATVWSLRRQELIDHRLAQHLIKHKPSEIKK